MAKNPKKQPRRLSHFRGRIHRRPKKRLSLLTLSGTIAGATVSLSGKTPILQAVINGVEGKWGWDEVGRNLMRETVGYDPVDKNWSLPALPTLAIAGFAAHKIVGMTGVNKTMRNIPMLGKYIEL